MYGNVINRDAVVVVPSDVTLFVRGVCNGIYIGGAGNVTVLTEIGSVVTFTAPPVGSIIPIRATRVNATATTATLMLAMY